MDSTIDQRPRSSAGDHRPQSRASAGDHRPQSRASAGNHRPQSRASAGETTASRRSGYGQAEPQDVTQVFRRFDLNGDGKIDRKELVSILQELDPVRWTDRNTTLLLMSIDTNFDGFVDYAEFVEWIHSDGTEQKAFRAASGMPRSREALFRLEKERLEKALKGTAMELDKQKAIAAHTADVLKIAEARVKVACARYELHKAEAEEASHIFMPMYNRYRDALADVSTPAKEILAIEIKDVCETVSVATAAGVSATVQVPPIEIQLTVCGMCILFKAHPGTRVDSEQDYLSAFLEGVINPKLLLQMDKYDKESVSGNAARRLQEICEDERFEPQRVREATQGMKNANFFVVMCLWLHFLSLYSEVGMKKLWDEVRSAELDMEKEKLSCANKGEELRDATRRIAQLEEKLKSNS